LCFYSTAGANTTDASFNFFFFFHSKSLRKEQSINTYRDLTKTEKQEITDDLQVCVIIIFVDVLVFRLESL